MNLLQNFHLAVLKYLYRGRRAVPLQTFTSRHSNRKLSTTSTQCAPETTKFGKKQRKINAILPFKVIQGHQFWYQSKAHIRLPIKTIARKVLRIKSWIYESVRRSRIYTVGIVRSLCRRLLQDIVIVNCTIVMALSKCQPRLHNAPQTLPNSVKQRKIRAISQFKVIQGNRFWYQSKAHIRLPISD